MGINKDRAQVACRAILRGTELGTMLLFLDSRQTEAALLRSSLQSGDGDDVIVDYLRPMAAAATAQLPATPPGATGVQVGGAATGITVTELAAELAAELVRVLRSQSFNSSSGASRGSAGPSSAGPGSAGPGSAGPGSSLPETPPTPSEPQISNLGTPESVLDYQSSGGTSSIGHGAA